MSGLREVLLCEVCQERHDKDCGTPGCECWCYEEDCQARTVKLDPAVAADALGELGQEIGA